MLAALAHGKVKGGRAAVEQALEGMALADCHPMLIRLHLDHITLLDQSAAAVEDEIEAALGAIPAAWGVCADGVRSADPGPDAAALTAVQRLAEIPGVSPKLAMAIIATTGLDMTRFPTAAHLASWAGLAPVARQSGPRQRKPQKGHGDAYLKGYCTQAANGAANTSTFLGETAPPAVPPAQREQGQVRRRTLHPRHHLAPPRRSRCQVHRPRPGCPSQVPAPPATWQYRDPLSREGQTGRPGVAGTGRRGPAVFF